jgi:hypothetical protein
MRHECRSDVAHVACQVHQLASQLEESQISNHQLRSDKDALQNELATQQSEILRLQVSQIFCEKGQCDATHLYNFVHSICLAPFHDFHQLLQRFSTASKCHHLLGHLCRF